MALTNRTLYIKVQLHLIEITLKPRDVSWNGKSAFIHCDKIRSEGDEMKGRCKMCGTVTSNVTVCNSCSIASEDRRFLKMVNREELKSTRRILSRLKKSPQTDAVTEG